MFTAGGSSSSTGFQISATHHPSGIKVRAKTPGHEWETSTEHRDDSWRYDLWVWLHLIGFTFRRAYRQYHGAEQKIVYVLKHDLPLTVDACRRAPRLTPDCGTVVLVLPPPRVRRLSLAALVSAIFVKGRGPSLLLALFGIVSFAKPHSVAMLVQRYMTTLEPNEEQLAEAVEVGKTIIHEAAVAEEAKLQFAAILDEETIEELLRQAAEAAKPEAEAETET